MSHAYVDTGTPIADRIDKMKQSIKRLEGLQFYYPDLKIKQTPEKDIYTSKSIWRDVEDLEVLQGSNTIKVAPYKDLKIKYHDVNDFHTYESEYRVYTDPMEICLVGYYYDGPGSMTVHPSATPSLKDRRQILQIQNYMAKLEGHEYKKTLLKKIEYELYSYLKKTIIEAPKMYRIENEENLPEKLSMLITFA
jgi:hypothetical protein